MAIKVYNTLTKQKEDFVPINEGKANIYVCGVTPYNHPHVGNARPFVTFAKLIFKSASCTKISLIKEESGVHIYGARNTR
ncbi:MAG: hypothetical protein IJ947_01500, partial [Phascolarctobacterium sp.]|nr:hypothetical protein [Phascolarctobacterium sp.]